MKTELHPTFTHASLLADICKPLDHFDINCFGYVHINNALEMTYLRNQPHFTKIYHSKNYHLADLHTAKGHFGEFVLWDGLNCSGKANSMLQDVNAAGFHQIFSIIENDTTGSHFYHFATGIPVEKMNMSQLYLSNMDALKAFIHYFKNTTESAKELSSWRDIKFSIEKKHTDIELPSKQMLISNDVNRGEFFEEIGFENKFQQLTMQQQKCVDLLLRGYSPRQIASEMQLTYKTIEHYLAHVRAKFQCKTTRELILKLK